MKQQAFDFKHELGWDFEDILLRNYLTHTKKNLQPYSKLKQFAKIQFLNDKKKDCPKHQFDLVFQKIYG